MLAFFGNIILVEGIVQDKGNVSYYIIRSFPHEPSDISQYALDIHTAEGQKEAAAGANF